ncbi:MAG: hypothetical protein JOZ80_03045, partial [Acidobacteriaceae bacterium]|nr:hypothetical protein [Acidobacteriaceae bacterium]
MQPFSNIRILLHRAKRASSNAPVFTSSSPSQPKKRFAGVVTALLGIAVACMLVPSPVRAATPDSPQPDAATVARAQEAFIKHMSAHRPLVRVSKPGAEAVTRGGITSAASLNWSGFADIEGGSKTISSVSGEWVIPYVQCPSGNYKYTGAYTVNWVGIDGATNGTVEQLGSGTQCFEGVEYYYVWYEMFPAGTVIEGTQACINKNVNCP